MTTPIDLARQELAAGVKEPAAYARYSGGRNEAWCAHFVSWLFRQVGKPLPGSILPGPKTWSPTAGVNYIVKTMRDAGKLLPPGAVPQANDLIFYKHKDPATGTFDTKGVLYGLPFVYGHVGLVEGVVDEGGVKKVVTIEGNYSDSVARVKTRLDSPTIGGFARPVGGFGIGVGALAVLGIGGFLLARKLRK
ncbi:MAG: CHAP domain-containing protein [Betaproteobacteria bacterium]|nr:CHAP domain-containing protein [Betaproteobacteria bacterium]NCA16976.1 CHAP domain-containing protein [Betaproteobacteria bacterium]